MSRQRARLARVLLVLLLSAAPVTAVADTPDRPTELFLSASALSGASLLDADPDAGGTHRGFVGGVRWGLRVSRPPAVLGGNRTGVLVSMTLRYEPAAQRTEWVGSVGFVAHVSKLFLISSVGYGQSLVGDVSPRHLLDASVATGLKLGSLWLGIEVSSLLRIGQGSGNHTLQVLANIGWEFEVPG
jgi:hypothetical protein